MSFTQTAEPSMAHTRISFLTRAIQAYNRRRIYNETVRSLRSLSDRELDDIGIPRGMIHEVAERSANNF